MEQCVGATGGGHTGQRRIIIFIPIPVLPDDGTSLRRRRRRNECEEQYREKL